MKKNDEYEMTKNDEINISLYFHWNASIYDVECWSQKLTL